MAGSEEEVFTEYYAILCSTVTDVHLLLRHFVVENIFKPDVLEEIKAINIPSQKTEKLLGYISGPLQSGNTKPFYSMLKIMEQHGAQATKELAKKMKSLFPAKQVVVPKSGEGKVCIWCV